MLFLSCDKDVSCIGINNRSIMLISNEICYCIFHQWYLCDPYSNIERNIISIPQLSNRRGTKLVLLFIIGVVKMLAAASVNALQKKHFSTYNWHIMWCCYFKLVSSVLILKKNILVKNFKWYFLKKIRFISFLTPLEQALSYGTSDGIERGRYG